jgi:hypothetical protein
MDVKHEINNKNCSIKYVHTGRSIENGTHTHTATLSLTFSYIIYVIRVENDLLQLSDMLYSW